jgi:hypothetical protein
MRKFVSLIILVITGIAPVIALDNNEERSQKSINSSDHTGMSFESPRFLHVFDLQNMQSRIAHFDRNLDRQISR